MTVVICDVSNLHLARKILSPSRQHTRCSPRTGPSGVHLQKTSAGNGRLEENVEKCAVVPDLTGKLCTFLASERRHRTVGYILIGGSIKRVASPPLTFGKSRIFERSIIFGFSKHRISNERMSKYYPVSETSFLTVRSSTLFNLRKIYFNN